ncbi:MAG: condensation domain-containing protein, partial [Cyanobacteria bacterium J06607_6]
MKNVADIYPLSPVQLGMLFHTLANSQAGVYVNQYTCQLHGSVQPDLLRQAWQQTLVRHPVLRTAFLWEELDEPLQIVRQEVDLPWQELDWRGLSETKQAAKLEEFLQRDRTQVFDLAQAPILRLTLIQLKDDTYQLIWSSHHLLFDGWSLPLIWQDMLTYYAARQQGNQPQLSPLRPYRDYIAWHQSQDFTAAEAFWRSQLQGFSEPTPLPAVRTGVGTSNSLYCQQTLTLHPSLTANLNTLARQHRLTLNTLIQGAWALLLSHYSSEDEVTYGSVVSGRPAELSGVESMVGLFINTLPVRVAVEPNQSLIPWLQSRHQQLLDLRQYEAIPLTDIQRWSDIPAGSPLFESIVVFENYPTASAPDLGFATSDARYLEQSNYPLALLVVPGESLELLLLFDPARFEAGAIARLLAHLELLLTAFVEQPQTTLADLPRLTPAEQEQLANWKRTDYPQDCTIHQLIEAQVQKTPDAEAVVFAGQTLTYADLNQQAEQLADTLRSHGVGRGDRVALCLTPSLDRIISIFAVLKAGAAYVPLDPAYPAARLNYCLRDTEPQMLLTQRSVELPDTDVRCLYLDVVEEALQGTQETRETRHVASLQGDGATPSPHHLITPSPSPTAADLAYIIYTSGSTGQPKGVMVSHRNLVHSTTARSALPSRRESHVYPDLVGRFLLLSSIAFDSSVAGIFWTLCQGGTLVLPPERIEQDLQQLAKLIAQQQITHTLCVPTLYALLLDAAAP